MASGVGCVAGGMTTLPITVFGCDVDAGNIILGPILLSALTSPLGIIIEGDCPCVFCTGVGIGGVGVVIVGLCEGTETESLTMGSVEAESTGAELKSNYIWFQE